ncbi:hypothetical protein [Deinococcus hopiensis]|uniref:hypothetical protein n=1 Tax=Deinococcus hopiensis TaxID=309885 RepID=UPI0009FFB279|nr:hypothetical protein [Deinococcus hopiensis]
MERRGSTGTEGKERMIRKPYENGALELSEADVTGLTARLGQRLGEHDPSHCIQGRRLSPLQGGARRPPGADRVRAHRAAKRTGDRFRPGGRRPNTPEHVLIVPNLHFEKLYGQPTASAAAIHDAAH